MRKIYRNTIIASICIAVLIIVVSVIWNVQKNLPNTARDRWHAKIRLLSG